MEENIFKEMIDFVEEENASDFIKSAKEVISENIAPHIKTIQEDAIKSIFLEDKDKSNEEDDEDEDEDEDEGAESLINNSSNTGNK